MRYKGYKLIERNGRNTLLVCSTLTEAELTAKGCMPLERAEKPNDGKKYRAVYTETDGVIHQAWEAYE